MTITVLCTVCGINEVPAPNSIEIDPICDGCARNNADQVTHTIAGIEIPILEFKNDEGGCPGWNDSCGNILELGTDLCPDCTIGRMTQQSPRIPQ